MTRVSGAENRGRKAACLLLFELVGGSDTLLLPLLAIGLHMRQSWAASSVSKGLAHTYKQHQGALSCVRFLTATLKKTSSESVLSA